MRGPVTAPASAGGVGTGLDLAGRGGGYPRPYPHGERGRADVTSDSEFARLSCCGLIAPETPAADDEVVGVLVPVLQSEPGHRRVSRRSRALRRFGLKAAIAIPKIRAACATTPTLYVRQAAASAPGCARATRASRRARWLTNRCSVWPLRLVRGGGPGAVFHQGALLASRLRATAQLLTGAGPEQLVGLDCGQWHLLTSSGSIASCTSLYVVE